MGIFANVLLAVFNLLPIPPLDGSRVVQYALSGSALEAYRELERFGLALVVLLVVLFPPAQTLLVEATFYGTEGITRMFEVWANAEPLLQHVLFG